jgi:cystathionine beta-lyase
LVDSLTLFKIGYSWGGVTSLAMPHFDLPQRYRVYGNRLVRFNIGLEVVGDLLADLERGFATLRT